MLSTALVSNALSPKHKMFLAFAIAKAFWQYYESNWMRAEWSLETIQLLQTRSLESEAPFLKIKPADSRDATYCEYEPGGGLLEPPRSHPYPYILNLALLLVQLGSITRDKPSITEDATQMTNAQKNSEIFSACFNQLFGDEEWPTIQLSANFKPRYRRIVEECLPIQSKVPKPLFEEHLDATGRRLALKDYVVGPLFDLFQDMEGPNHMARQRQNERQPDNSSVLQGVDGIEQPVKTPR